MILKDQYSSNISRFITASNPGESPTAVLGALIVFDGEFTWLEGLMLLGLYLIIAASVWYGPPVRL